MAKRIILFICIIALVSNLSAQETVTSYSDEELKVLSWNIYMLPPFAYMTNKRARGKAIGDYLNTSDYDIAILQEAFKHGARRMIKRRTKASFPYRKGPANIRYVTIFRTNSGIWMLSKYPIEKLGVTKFKQKAGFDNKMARKGALMVEMEKNGKKYHFVGTHLNAGGPIEVRRSQVVQIKELVEKHEMENVPVIIAGDFNINIKSDTYPFILETLGVEDGVLTGERQCTTSGDNDYNRDNPNKCEVIDYIFYKGNGVDYEFIERSLPVIEYPFKEGRKSLADHEPVEMYIKF
jgi:sphingomyelin phosphodiesterase